jgi:hypothetical protein
MEPGSYIPERTLDKLSAFDLCVVLNVRVKKIITIVKPSAISLLIVVSASQKRNVGSAASAFTYRPYHKPRWNIG